MLWTNKIAINDKFLEVGLNAIQQAEKVVLNHFGQQLNVDYKENYSPVTAADIEAESLIRNVINQNFPNHGFIGEEGGEEDEKKEFVWIIDPIDGTKPYVRGFPYFGTILALLHNNQLIMSISYMPQEHSLAYAVKNKGAFINHQPIKLNQEKNIKDAYITTANIKYFELNGFTSGLINLSLNAHYLRSYAELWGWHLFFQGKFDAQLEAYGQIWDLAAHALITQEAGGTVTDFNGEPFTAASTNIIASNSFLHPKILQYFRERN